MAFDYKIVSGTTTNLATFETAVETELSNGYEPIGNPSVSGTDIFQAVGKHSGVSVFVQQFPITDVVDGSTGSFTISGMEINNFPIGFRFQVINSTGNDGVYTVAAPGSHVSGPDTIIPVSETIPDATVDGVILNYV